MSQEASTRPADLAPGQFYGKRWVIYSALSEPRINIETWRLAIKGLVEHELSLSFDELSKMPQVKVVKSFQCLLPDSIVFANPEPKPIQNLAIGDFIIGRDGKRHEIKELIRRQHSGPVIGVKASYLPSVVMTPEHPVLVVKGDKGSGKSKSHRRQRTFRNQVKPKWVRADELSTDDYVFFPKYREVSTEKNTVYEGRQIQIDERLAYVLGWYVAEGSGSDSESRGVTFGLGGNEQEHVDDLRALLKELFDCKTSVYYNETRTSSRIVVTSSNFRDICRAFKLWCGEKAASKKIPNFILNSEPSVLRAFLKGYYEGDGYSPKKTGKASDKRLDFIDLTTLSSKLAYQLILALSKIGVPAEMVKHPGSVRPAFSIRARGEKVRNLLPEFQTYEKINKFHYWETDDGFYYPIRKIWTEHYAGEVYDFRAPGFAMLSPFVTQDCVTQWSIKDVVWEGVAFRELAKIAGVKPEAKWVMFRCAEGYTAPVPLEDAMVEDSLIAFKMNGQPIPWQQGFPARPFIPQLYGWKSAKWLTEIEFIPEYRDGYWEMYGYHERGDIWDEERFKGHSGKHSKRRALGTVPI